MRRTYLDLSVLALPALLIICAAPLTAFAGQVDIGGPQGSIAFGQQVAALPNGNIVVIDPGALPNDYPGPPWPPMNGGLGAVYLYDPSGKLISQVNGGTPNDHIGSGGLYVLRNGNFVVVSPQWSNGTASAVGAVTWIDGSTGLSGVVAVGNSLVGSATGDFDELGVTVLPNGNYVVGLFDWKGQRGAAVWADGTTGISGTVGVHNALIGELPRDYVGLSVTALTNGNYVVLSTPKGLLAATLGNGTTGIAGPISAAKSLHSSTDAAGYALVAPLQNGAWVLASGSWNALRGAVTWADGTKGQDDVVSEANSIVGTTPNDRIGLYITPLANGNYVVPSMFWNGGFGAATWADGTKTTSAIVSASNSLVGSAPGDSVGSSVTVLTNGNYVVNSSGWSNGRGAATWADGSRGVSGTISESNSLIGTEAGDGIGLETVALANGNYVTASWDWSGGRGAATWGNGTIGLTGQVSPLNSLVGRTYTDGVGLGTIAALANGNYVVTTPNWNSGFGAATWADGLTGGSGLVSASNSLVGSSAVGFVGTTAFGLPNGSYIVGSGLGTTWCRGTAGESATVSRANSLVGVNSYWTTPLSDGNYVTWNPFWNQWQGAVTLVNGAFRVTGMVEPWNTVFGTTPQGGQFQSFAYDPTRQQLAVGRPYDNIVSLIRIERLFTDSFEGE